MRSTSIGGIQAMNRRFQHALRDWARETHNSPPIIHYYHDHKHHHHDDHAIIVRAFASQTSPFYLKSLGNAVLFADLLLIDSFHLHMLALVIRIFRPRLPILMFIHSREYLHFITTPHRFWYRYSAWLAQRYAITHFLPVSRHIWDQTIKTHTPPHRFTVLYNAIDPINDNSKPPPPLLERPRIVLTISRLHALKNIDSAIHAFAAIADAIPDYTYHIVGDGPERGALETLVAQLQLSHRIHFKGALTGAALRDAYHQTRLVIHPSRQEAFGLIILEAWQNGTTILCDKNTGCAEIVTDAVNGFNIDTADITAFSATLRLALADLRRLQNMADHGRTTLVEKFSLPIYRKKLSQILDNFLPS